ncbi:DUF2971 domain-containing protein [Plesiomonas shigelloides]|nr:hypothetical protein C7R88_03665 [Plesiomonas shigelloides]KAB7691267.1 DUF2971 domain-containing protein [Plesiomonas shigelloides]
MHHPSLILHHYTSGTGLLGIFNNSSMWATKIQYMNDSTEYLHAISLAKSRLAYFTSGATESKESILASKVAELLERTKELALYVVCFSEVSDSLSQWRGYCPPSFGYSIGFNADRLKELAENQGFELGRCIYDNNIQKSLIDNWVDETIKSLSIGYEPEQDIEDYCNKNADKHIHAFVRIAPYLKHQTFEAEQEWRLVSLIPSNDKRLGLREGKSMLIPYATFELNLCNEDNLIWNIQVGPTPKIDLAFSALSHLFNKVKIMNGITRTFIPYRDW